MAKKTRKEADKKQHDEVSGDSKRKNKFIVIGVIVAVVAAIAFYGYRLDNTIDSSFASIDGITCETKEYSTFHVHAHLDIFVDGHPLTVPEGVGFGVARNKVPPVTECLYWLHTHKPDGIIHIESPQTHNFTLGQFFDVWKSTSGGAPPTNEEPIIHVNGDLVTTKLNETPLNAHDEIVLVYGNPPPNIPTFYQFPEGL